MKMRYAIEAVLFSLFIYIGYISWMIFEGYTRTKNDVPDILSNYKNTGQMEYTASVSLGKINEMDSIFILGGIIIGCGLYYSIRVALSKKAG